MSNFKVISNKCNFPHSLHKQYKLALLLEQKLLENIQNIINTFPDALCLIPFHKINSILFYQNILTRVTGKITKKKKIGIKINVSVRELMDYS